MRAIATGVFVCFRSYIWLRSRTQYSVSTARFPGRKHAFSREGIRLWTLQ